MEQTPSDLLALLIPYAGGEALLPNSAVVQVLPYARPLPAEQAPSWVLGTLLWRSRVIPLVSIDALVDGEPVAPGPGARMVIVNALGADPALWNFALLATAAPHIAQLGRDAVQPSADTRALPMGVLARARVADTDVVIPDLAALEAALRPHLAKP